MIQIKEPNPMDYTIIEATALLIKDDKYEDGRIEITCIRDMNDGMEGWHWIGMKVKDLYRGDKCWYKILLNQKLLYLALFGGWNTTLEARIWYQNKWHIIWRATNNFESFAEKKIRSQLLSIKVKK